jgi:hypothetical protein
MHRTVWGYNVSGALGNTIFASTLIINKSGAPVDSMFFVQWSDPDLGDAGDDFAGCDIQRNLGFVYNGLNSDPVYGVEVPAVGYALVQGPIIKTGNPRDTAIFRLNHRKGYRNREMTASAIGVCGNAAYACPPAPGVGADIQWYRIMNGTGAVTDQQYIDPTTNQPTKFVVSGDPATGQGWVDGTFGLTPGDRNLSLSTGPFSLANGDSQEIVIASIVGVGADRISSINVLKQNTDVVQTMFNGLLQVPTPPTPPEVIPAAFSLSQSYPNPFNLTARIQFTIANSEFTILNVYDMLGREVSVLVNEERDAGFYEVRFDGLNLPSGVYFYRLQAGDFSQTKKLVLLR